jgi:hypothetical protein
MDLNISSDLRSPEKTYVADALAPVAFSVLGDRLKNPQVDKYLNLKHSGILGILRLQASHAGLSYRLTQVLVYWSGRFREALGSCKVACA